MRKQTSSDLGKGLQDALDAKGWSQRVLAQRSGVHAQQIYKILSGETHNPGVRTMIRLAKTLGVTLDELVCIEKAD